MQNHPDSKTADTMHQAARIFELVAPWMALTVFLLLGWRVYDIFHDIPAYGDVLEVLWGSQWYHDSLFVAHTSPLFTPLVFHPNGWHTATLAHSPMVFILSLPLYEVGGAAFAYNCLALLSFYVAFSGAMRFMRLFVPKFPAVIAALLYTFMGMRWIRAGGGHIHILWASSLLPWLAWSLERIRRSGKRPPRKRLLWLCGLIWGLMINFSLYSIFLGGTAFSMWGRRIFSLSKVKQLAAITAIALVVSAPTTIPYTLGIQQDQVESFEIPHALHWGASLNSLASPFVFHPLDWVKDVTEVFYTGSRDESGIANLGPVTCLLGLTGLVFLVKRKGPKSLIWLMAIGLLLSLGLLLKWDGEVVTSPIFQSLNSLVWQIGHALKPGLFASQKPIHPFDEGIPLPGFLLAATVPFWESARVMTRYALVGGLGLIALAAYGLWRLPKAARYALAAIWLLEVLPIPTGSLPLPTQLHPAYQWLVGHPLPVGEGIADIEYPSIKIDGETLFATQLHQTPIVAGTGSFWPQHTLFLWEYFIDNEQALASPEAALVLRSYRVRYIFLHQQGRKEEAMWSQISQNPLLHPIGCFAPAEGPSPWPHPICIAEVADPPDPFNVMLRKGWSGREAWGIWADGTESRIRWVAASQTDHVLHLEAFPHCVPGEHQSITVEANGTLLMAHQWQDCEPWLGEVTIPASIVKTGWNDIQLTYAYALSPAELTGGENPDPRQLSTGFTRLEIERR
jgi:hypothetical protein